MGGFWVHVGTLWGSIWGPRAIFSALFVLLNLCWILLDSGCRWGSQGEQPTADDVVPAPAFSDICGRNRGFAQEGLHFQDSGISAPLKELTFSQLFQEFRKDFQPEGGDPAGIPDSGRISSRRVEIQQEVRNPGRIFQPEGGDPAGRRSSHHSPCMPEADW